MFISSVFVVLFAGTVDWRKTSETLQSPPNCDHCAVQSGDTLQLLTMLEEKTDFHTIRQLVGEYFTQHGSTVNVWVLDITKAFHKVNHYSLFLKLMKRDISPTCLNVLIGLYSKWFRAATWNCVFSRCILISYVELGKVEFCLEYSLLSILII